MTKHTRPKNFVAAVTPRRVTKRIDIAELHQRILALQRSRARARREKAAPTTAAVVVTKSQRWWWRQWVRSRSGV